MFEKDCLKTVTENIFLTKQSFLPFRKDPIELSTLSPNASKISFCYEKKRKGKRNY